MILKLFYKEWLKTRFVAFAALLLGAGLVCYIYFEIQNNLRLGGAFSYMMHIMYGDPQANFYRKLMIYFPLLVALAVGLSQYIPEVLEKRIKLTLHLPIKNTTALYGMLLYGLVLLTLLYCVVFGAMFIIIARVFPAEIVIPILVSVTPWIMGGYAAYFIISMIALEPTILRQILYAVVGYFFVKQYYIGHLHGDTLHALPLLGALVAVSCIGLLYTSDRFIKGER